MIFYRFTSDGRRKTVDLEDAYRGALILCGGHPSLADEPLECLSRRGIVTMAMNNAALLFRPTMWTSADHPDCYSRAILDDPAILKFARLLYSGDTVGDTGRLWRDWPSTLFYGVSDDLFTPATLLDRHPLFAWWKNVFLFSLQLAWRLGFREVYLAGVGFNFPSDRHYAFDMKLNPDEAEYNRRTYEMTADQFLRCLPHFKERGFRIVSCTPGSVLNEVVPFMPLTSVVERVLRDYPQETAGGVKHSSRFAS
jgi:hypothetical protein